MMLRKFIHLQAKKHIHYPAITLCRLLLPDGLNWINVSDEDNNLLSKTANMYFTTKTITASIWRTTSMISWIILWTLNLSPSLSATQQPCHLSSQGRYHICHTGTDGIPGSPTRKVSWQAPVQTGLQKLFYLPVPLPKCLSECSCLSFRMHFL